MGREHDRNDGHRTCHHHAGQYHRVCDYRHGTKWHHDNAPDRHISAASIGTVVNTTMLVAVIIVAVATVIITTRAVVIINVEAATVIIGMVITTMWASVTAMVSKVDLPGEGVASFLKHVLKEIVSTNLIIQVIKSSTRISIDGSDDIVIGAIEAVHDI
jgi:hypothetical protein